MRLTSIVAAVVVMFHQRLGDHFLGDISAKGKSALSLLFLLPAMPKGAMSYVARLVEFGLGEFVVVTGLARSPALLSSVLLGSQAEKRNWGARIITGAAGAAAIGAAYLYEHRRRQKTGVS